MFKSAKPIYHTTKTGRIWLNYVFFALFLLRHVTNLYIHMRKGKAHISLYINSVISSPLFLAHKSLHYDNTPKFQQNNMLDKIDAFSLSKC